MDFHAFLIQTQKFHIKPLKPRWVLGKRRLHLAILFLGIKLRLQHSYLLRVARAGESSIFRCLEMCGVDSFNNLCYLQATFFNAPTFQPTFQPIYIPFLEVRFPMTPMDFVHPFQSTAPERWVGHCPRAARRNSAWCTHMASLRRKSELGVSSPHPVPRLVSASLHWAPG